MTSLSLAPRPVAESETVSASKVLLPVFGFHSKRKNEDHFFFSFSVLAGLVGMQVPYQRVDLTKPWQLRPT
jgi:hypothetical protein